MKREYRRLHTGETYLKEYTRRGTNGVTNMGKACTGWKSTCRGIYTEESTYKESTICILP